MSKYSELEEHLGKSSKNFVAMQFSDIERIIKDRLPPSARKYRAWWSNNPSNSVITFAWMRAGYKTSEVNMKDEKLVFRRVKNPMDPATDNNGDGDQPKEPFRHPVFGCMAGTVTIAGDVDLTEPAMPEWAEMAEEKYGKDGPDFT